MSGHNKTFDVVSPGSVDPDLVLQRDFGVYTSYQRDGERVWQFRNEWAQKKFLMVGHLPKYKRKEK